MKKGKKNLKYKRILLKLTGELFGGKAKKGLDFEAIEKLASYLHKIHKSTGVEMAVVVGAGNILRGREVAGTKVDKATADYIGMLGTVINALALQEALERLGSVTRALSSITIQAVCEPFIRRRAIRHLEKGRIVILAGGTGRPFFTTDSAAALMACELSCDAILKASNVKGVYSRDPKKDKKARFYKKLDYQYALENGLQIMDNTAFALCQREKMPIVVFNVNKPKNIEKIIRGEKIGTLVTWKEKQKLLFKKFSRVERKKETAIKGTGLGLYICKTLIEGMGGKIWLTSKLGQGSTFTFSLKVKE